MPPRRQLAKAATEVASEEPPTKRLRAAATDSALSSSKKPAARSKKAIVFEAPKERVENLWKAGAHVSAAGGVENAIVNASKIGANAFALFLKSQRKWTSAALTDKSIKAFKQRLEEYKYDVKHILPHGSYLINLGNPDAEKRAKSYECFLDDLKRCEQLGLLLYNFHPGSTVGNTTPEKSMALIAESINNAHKATTSVVVVLENMAGAGSVIGRDFAQLKSIIDGVEDKTRVGVCLDTCHMFAAGYDIRTKDGWEKTMKLFEDTVGISYLRGMHLNDSKTPLDSKKDRHENLGLGHVGLAAFQYIFTDPRVQDIPLVLETPSQEKDEVWTTEIDILNRLSTLDEEGSMEKMSEMAAEVRAIVKSAGGGKKSTTKKGSKKKQEEEEESCGSDHDGD